MAYKLIAADLDRTLLRSDGTVSDFTKETIRKCMEAGQHQSFSQYVSQHFVCFAEYGTANTIDV